MKRTTKQTPGMDRRPVRERITLSVADLAQVSGGDLYMQNPRGSNDRPTTGGGGGGGW